MYDIIIIGAGPAGISAAVYGKSRGKKVLVLEKKQVGGLIGTVSIDLRTSVSNFSQIIFSLNLLLLANYNLHLHFIDSNFCIF